MGTQVTYMRNLPQISSEFIEPYAQRFFMMQLEAIYFGLIQPEEARATLKGVEYFVSCFGGLHAQIAISNVYEGFFKLSDDEIRRICKKNISIMKSGISWHQ